MAEQVTEGLCQMDPVPGDVTISLADMGMRGSSSSSGRLRPAVGPSQREPVGGHPRAVILHGAAAKSSASSPEGEWIGRRYLPPLPPALEVDADVAPPRPRRR